MAEFGLAVLWLLFLAVVVALTVVGRELLLLSAWFLLLVPLAWLLLCLLFSLLYSVVELVHLAGDLGFNHLDRFF